MVSEYKIQVFVDGWWLNTGEMDSDYEYIKRTIKFLRAKNPNAKYRIMGRECHPWCEIKED